MAKQAVRPRLIGDPAQHNVSVAAGTAWKWIKSGEKRIEEIQRRTVIEWKKIGEGFRIGRAWAKREAGIADGTNQPIDGRLGRGFSTKFSEWLAAYGLNDIDEKTRHDLSKFMDSAEIQAWHAALPDSKRLKLNHPTAIVRAWKRINDQSAFPQPDGSQKDEPPKQRTERVANEAIAAQLDATTKQLAQMKIAEGKRAAVDLMQSDVAEIEKWLEMRIINEHRGRAIRDAFLRAFPLDLPKVQPTTDAAGDDIGLPQPELDDVDRRIAGERTAAYNARKRPRAGDWCIMLDGTVRRFSGDGGTSLDGGDNGSYHLSEKGTVRYSGGNDCFADMPPFKHLRQGNTIRTPEFELQQETRPGVFWFGHHGVVSYGSKIDFTIDCRVYKVLPPK
jgi:hypothetical protein